MSDFNPKEKLLEKIATNGGWVNAHSHIDRSFILNETNFKLVDGTLMEKWNYPDEYKRNASVEDIYKNMCRVLDMMIEQGVTAIASFIDVDPVVEDKAIQAAKRVREEYSDKITIKFINQVVKGVIEPEARKWFEVGAEFVDIIGGLPEKDEGYEAEHLDILFETAKKFGNKPLHVHVDQLNLPTQQDTELLIDKTIEHNYQGKVVAVHSISVGAQSREYRTSLYERLAEAGIIVVACPCGWIDNSWVAGLDHDVIGPIHNSVTPVKEMLAAGVVVALGTDNIQDIYKPFSDGSMWTELRFLLEAQRLYDLDALAAIASTNGRKALFLDQ
ncbi:MAG TPA: amidohydrolase family protein [Candidatus Saccharimonadales bacterium]